MLRVVWCWRQHVEWAVLLPYLAVALAAATCAVGGIIFGIFSSYVVDSSNIEVLLRSDNCGTFTIPRAIQFQDPLWIAHNTFWMEGVNLGTTYVRQCYNASSPSSSACNVFTVPTVSWDTDYLAPCPFDGEMCLGPAMTMDSGPINTNDILGLNFPKEDRLGFRKVSTCSPITQDGYVTVMNSSDPDAIGDINVPFIDEDQATVYWYGPAVSVGTYNSTWAADLYANNITRRYQLSGFKYWGRNASKNDFYPIRELNRSDGDGVLFFFQSGVVPSAIPIDDPIFSAHKKQYPFWDTTNSTYYYFADDIAAVIGCFEQYQVCIPSRYTGQPECINLTGLDGIVTDAQQSLKLTSIQNSTLTMLYNEIRTWRNDIELASWRPNLDLLAQKTVSLTVQYGLPRNQWQIEVEDWFATVWATLMQRLVLRVVGPMDHTSQQYITPPQTPEETAICRAQKVRMGQGFSNISLFGLLFVLCLGSVIIATSILLEFLGPYLSRFSKSSVTARRNWLLDDALHLQRLAYKGQSQPADGRWIHEDRGIPLVQPQDRQLGPLLDQSDAASRPVDERVPDSVPSTRATTPTLPPSRTRSFPLLPLRRSASPPIMRSCTS